MPIATISAKLVYFAHVPRCGGTSVENYLRGRFGPLALLDRQFIADPLLRTWCRSSPQHMEVAVLDRLIPPAFFAATFALVRHPADRLASVFRFQRDIERTIDPATGFTTWLDGLPKRLAEDPFHLDNHLRPMTDLVPANAVIFRLENGMEPVLTWIDELAGDTRGARKMPTANSHADRLALALRLLADERFDALVGDVVPFEELPHLMTRLAAGEPFTPCVRVSYG